jgi:hypothetical protein
MSWFAEHSGTETDEGVSKTDTSFLLVGKTIQCYTEHEFDAKSAAGSEKTAGICQYTRTCAAGNSGRMEKRK